MAMPLGEVFLREAQSGSVEIKDGAIESVIARGERRRGGPAGGRGRGGRRVGWGAGGGGAPGGRGGRGGGRGPGGAGGGRRAPRGARAPDKSRGRAPTG